MRLQPVEALRAGEGLHNGVSAGGRRSGDDLAVLMLTSGSTGNAKAVGLRHQQILTSVTGKSAHHRVDREDVFLNWIGMCVLTVYIPQSCAKFGNFGGQFHDTVF